MSAANTTWVLIGSVLIFLMQAGFAMVETGFTRAKNAGDIALKKVINICIGTLCFWFVGFGIMFGSAGDVFGRFDFFIQGNYADLLPDGVPLAAFVMFQTALCVIASTIISGAMVERTKFSAYCTYCMVMTAVVYPVSGHWIWGDGWLNQLGFHDFSGSAAIHIVGGTAACVGAKMLGARIGKYAEDGTTRAIPGQNITTGALGVFMIWFCWFGLSGSSTLSMEGTFVTEAADIFIKTNLAAAAAGCSTMLVTWIRYKKPDVSLTLNGVLGGLVAVSAGCDTISTTGAVCIGIGAGVLMVFAIEWVEQKQKIDDPVGAISIHFICGVLGSACVGLFSLDGGLVYGGGFKLLAVQILGSLCISAWTGIVMYGVFYLIEKKMGLRVTEQEEIDGLDSVQHSLTNAYADFMPSMNAQRKEELSAVVEIPLDKDIPIQLDSRLAATPGALFKVQIITKQSKLEMLKTAMNQIGVTGMTVTQVLGCGIQKGAKDSYRGLPLEMDLLPKIQVDIVVAKVPVDTVVKAARAALHTGHIGDGKIFIYDVRDAVKVRTGETGYAAMQGLDII